MIKDYYEVLNLSRESIKDDLCESFRKLSFKWHPDRNSENRKTSYNKFCEICEAFEVLSDPEKRAIYDEYGILKLKNGFKKGDLFVGGYEFKGNPEEIFQKFFGTNDFYHALIQFEDQYSNYLDEKNNFKRNPPKDIVIRENISLLDIYHGQSLMLKFQKNVINSDGVTTSIVYKEK